MNWPTFYNYLGNDLVEPIPVENQHNTCWVNNPASEINLFSAAILSENVVSEHPLFFAGDQEERMTIKYSFIVRQYALEEDEYEFWRTLRESNVEGGNLFDKQPASVVGNIKNVSNPDEIILNYFSANGVTEQRVFVTKNELPKDFGSTMKCELDSILKSEERNYKELVLRKMNEGLIFYDLIMHPFFPIVYGLILSEPICSDCVFKGGDAQKPDFWE
ncbi:MAG: DUF4249 family protein [Bacteroidetes bacterium]|nr:DUF4249 family protein [Bacteroidota bacterium]MDA1120594.1 DUF4249 family protein [Bacteroidota bacterium]